MKLLVDRTLIGYAKPAVYSGFACAEHNTNKMSTFDIFDSFNPDVYIADANLLNNTVYKNIEERPAMRVCVLGSKDHPKHQEFKDRFGDLYLWQEKEVYGDVFDYMNSEFVPQYSNDIISISDDKVVDGIEKLVFPKSVRFKIFSPTVVNSIYYSGFVPGAMKKHFYKSAKITITEPENVYNVALAGGYPLVVFNAEYLLQELEINHSKQIAISKQDILNSGTNFDAVSKILKSLGLDRESSLIMSKKEGLI